MSETIIANRYAVPFLQLAKEQGVLEDVNRDMELLREACESNPQLKAVLSNPSIRGYKKLAILKSIFSQQVHSLTISLFDVIDRRNREEVLYSLSKEFGRLYKEHHNIQEVEVTSASPLTDALRSELSAKLANQLNKKIELHEQVRPELIGGLVVKIGDRLIDNSISTALQRLELSFEKN